MMSSKSKSVLSKLSHLIDIFPDKKALIITSKKDTRGKDIIDNSNDIEIYNFEDGLIPLEAEKIITSHSSLFKGIPNGIKRLVRTLNLKEIDVSDFDIICIEEAQFFSDLYKTVQYWVDALDKYVLVAALDSNWKREIFGQVHLLSSIATESHKVTANCRYCIRELGENVNLESLPSASFTSRTVDSEEEILIGGSKEYEATCRRHHPYSKIIKESLLNEFQNIVN